MNVWGKVFLGLTIVLAATDAYLVAVLQAHRSKWQKQIEEKRESLVQTESALQDARARVRDKQNELGRLGAVWGRFPDNLELDQPLIGRTHLDVAQGRALNAQDGTLAFSAGVDRGLREPSAEAPAPIVYVFANQADGSSRFLGEFELTTVQADQSAGKLTLQPPLPTSVAALQQLQDQSLRIRETIPSSWRRQFEDFFAHQAVLAEHLDFQRNELRIETEELTASKDILAQRLAELNGDPQPPAGASKDVVDGLVVTISDEEAARDAELETLDELRHEYARKIDELNAVVRQSKEAVKELPDYEESLAKPDPRTASVK